MLFDEKEMIDLCEKYGIPVVENNGVPMFEDKDMPEEFLISEVMNEPYVSYDDIEISSKKYSLNIPIVGNLKKRDEILGTTSEIKCCSIRKDKYYDDCTSTIQINKESKNILAA